MLALHKVGARRLDMGTSDDCGLPHIASLDADNVTRIQLLQRQMTVKAYPHTSVWVPIGCSTVLWVDRAR